MDDTGFFSSQVIDQALNTLDLKLVHWKSREMRPFRDRPESVAAFLITLSMYWRADLADKGTRGFPLPPSAALVRDASVF
jgi:Josephin